MMMPASTTASFNDIKNNNNNKKINDVQWNCGKKSAQPTSNSVNRKQKPKSDAEGPKKEKKRVFSSNPLKDGQEEEDVSRTVVSPGGICSDRVYIYTRARHPPIATYGVLTQESKVGERKRKLAAMATILRNKTVEGLDDENCNNSIISPPYHHPTSQHGSCWMKKKKKLFALGFNEHRNEMMSMKTAQEVFISF